MSRHLLVLAALSAALLPGIARAQCAGDGPCKMALAVYHFNVQYVAGGLQEFWEDVGQPSTWDDLDLTDAGVQDAIIRQSFLPLLELYDAHPDWGADFELQGLMVDAIAQRHPDVLALMQSLGAAGVVSFDSFHYSDELWTAQPAAAIARSFSDTRRSFAAADVPHGTAYFSQEGQFGPAMMDVAGPGSVAMIASNLFRLHRPQSARRPLFSLGGDRWALIASHSWSEAIGDRDFSVNWTFMDDGELLATGDLNPYFLPSFVADPEAVAAYEQRILDLVDQGFEPVSVSVAAQRILDAGYEPEPLPPMLDGAWQPDDTANVGLWMGDMGFLWAPGDEADNAVRVAYARAYTLVYGASMLLGADAPALDAAWRALELAGVSDSTGWNPYRSEVEYSFFHAAEASRFARDAVAGRLLEAGLDCPGEIGVGGGDGALRCVEEPGAGRQDAEPAWEGLAVGAQDPAVDVQTRWITDPQRPGATGLQVTFTGASQAEDPLRWIELSWQQQDLRFVPAGQRERFESVPIELFMNAEDAVGVPLGGGILDLGQGKLLVLDPQQMMLAARIHPDQDFVRFHDATPPREDPEVWELWFVDSDAEALALADRLLQRPDARFDAPPTPDVAPDPGCGCSQGARSPSALIGFFLLLIGLLSARRRR